MLLGEVRYMLERLLMILYSLGEICCSCYCWFFVVVGVFVVLIMLMLLFEFIELLLLTCRVVV